MHVCMSLGLSKNPADFLLNIRIMHPHETQTAELAQAAAARLLILT